MNGWKWVKRRLDVLFNKSAAEDEMHDEMRHHLEMEIRQNVEMGMDATEARRRAMVDFGGIERYKEKVRDARGSRMMDDLVQDTRLALRSLPKQPGFLVAVLMTLGIGIGGNVAMFGVMDRTLLRALPYPDADELVLGRVLRDGVVGSTISGPDFFDYVAETEAFEAVGAMTPFSLAATVTGPEGAERVASPFATSGFFETFGLAPAAGRYFLPEESEPGGAMVTVLSDEYWQRRFGGDPGVIGRVLSVDGRPTTVVGITPAGFRFMLDADLWLPIRRGQGMAGSRGAHNLTLVARLRPGSTATSTQAEVAAISARLESAFPDTNAGKGLQIKPLRAALSEDYVQGMQILMATVLALLLIACANVAGLLLARGSARKAEMAVRSVMGAGRGRLARQLLTENIYIALGAGVVGMLLAVWLQRGILSFMPMERLGDVQPGFSGMTLLFAVGLSLATVLLFGALPSLRVATTDPARDLKGTSRGNSSGRSRFRSGLVVVQVATTVVLLSVSGLLFRTFQELVQTQPGFNVDALVTASVSVPRSGYPTAESQEQFFRELGDRIQALPGVSAMAMGSHLPIQDPGGNYPISLPEDFRVEEGDNRSAFRRVVMPGYFETLGIPLTRGRYLGNEDASNTSPSVVISEALSTHLFGEDNPLGRTVAIDEFGETASIREVVGVAGDVLAGSPAYGADFAVYIPLAQASGRSMRLAVRTNGDVAGVVTGIRGALRSMDSNVPLSRVSTMRDTMSQSVSGERTIAIMLVLFASVALLLTAVGLYGVLAYRVSQQLREIGIRMALGASVQSVTRGIVGDGLKLVVFGLALGVPGAYGAGRLIQGMLFGVEAADPLTLLAVSGFLTMVAVTACILPAKRAARVNPTEAFRAE